MDRKILREDFSQMELIQSLSFEAVTLLKHAHRHKHMSHAGCTECEVIKKLEAILAAAVPPKQ